MYQFVRGYHGEESSRVYFCCCFFLIQIALLQEKFFRVLSVDNYDNSKITFYIIQNTIDSTSLTHTELSKDDNIRDVISVFSYLSLIENIHF